MQEISNKALVYVILLTLGVSLFSTFISLNRLQGMQSDIDQFGVTGFITDSQAGEARINITGSVSISLTNPTINWGTGYPNGSNPSCSFVNLSTVGSSNTSLNVNNCWTGQQAVAEEDDFIIENTGNVDVILNINSADSTTFFGFGDAATTGFAWRATNSTEPGSCAGEANGTWVEFDNSYQGVCQNLTYQAAADVLEVELNVSFPSSGIVLGQKNATVTFQAINASTV